MLSRSLALAIGKRTIPATTSRCIGCRRNSKFTTMPKLPPPPRTAPEQIRILLGAGVSKLSVGRHQVDRFEVVDRHAESADEATETAAGSQAAHAGVRYRAERRHESVRHALVIHFAEQRAALDPGAPRARIHADSTEFRQVDLHSAVAAGLARCAVAAALHRDQQVVRAREGDCCLDVGNSARLRDEGRVFVERGVQDQARLVVTLVSRRAGAARASSRRGRGYRRRAA